MLKIYFTASTSYNGELIQVYKKIFDLIKKHHVDILSGQQVINKKILDKDKRLSAEEIYGREKKLIDKTDVVVAEVSKPSLGVGSEIVYALSIGKIVLALVQPCFEDKISPMLIGNPSENLFLEYYREEGLAKIISNFIDNSKGLIENYKKLRKNRGKLIVIDGGDGSGKTTQANLLLSYLKGKGMPVKYFDFPQYYKSFHGKTVAKFLRGEFGNIDQISPYLASLAYALDRASVKKEMNAFMEKGGYIIANRYATSNMAHQGAKFKDEEQREDYLKWVYELEYKVHKIPQEDIVIYLYVPWEIGLKLTTKKGEREYLKGKEDIQEKDLLFRKASEEMYLKLAKRYKHWIKIDCVENGKLLTPEEIHKKNIKVLEENKII